MKIEQLKKRLNKDREMTVTTIRMPVDVIDDLKRIAPKLGFSGYQSLMKAYVGQGLRRDLERVDNEAINTLIASLKEQGVSEQVISTALNKVSHH